MHTADVLADACFAAGTRHVFTIMGDGNKQWLVAAARRGIRLLHVRHENAGLAMADGYARATGEVGVCSVTYSAGLTQLSTSMMVAARHRTPLVVIAGDLPAAQRGSGSSIDLDSAAFVQASGGLPVTVRSAQTAAHDMFAAFDLARSQRRPVVLLMPVDVQEAPAATHGSPARPRRLDSPVRTAAPSDQLADAASVIDASARPVILAGRGAVASGAHQELLDLAEQTRGLLATSLHAKGYLDGDPHSVGIAGSFSDWRARRLLSEADCVIAVGASLNAYTAGLGDLFPDARVVQVDSRPGGPELSAYDLAARPGDAVQLLGDAKTVLAQLREVMPARATGWRDDDAVAQLLAVDPRRVAIDNRPAALAKGTLDPRELMLALDANLPPDAAVTIGVGNFTWFPLQYLRNPGQRDFYATLDFVAIGQALATAIGAAVAAPGRPHVAIEGDASFMMHIQELETAARYSVPVLVFVLNDGALGAEYHKLKAAGLDPAESLLPSADVCEVATALGARATRLTDPADLDRVMTWFDPAEGPHVVDCPATLSVAGPA